MQTEPLETDSEVMYDFTEIKAWFILSMLPKLGFKSSKKKKKGIKIAFKLF